MVGALDGTPVCSRFGGRHFGCGLCRALRICVVPPIMMIHGLDGSPFHSPFSIAFELRGMRRMWWYLTGATHHADKVRNESDGGVAR